MTDETLNKWREWLEDNNYADVCLNCESQITWKEIIELLDIVEGQSAYTVKELIKANEKLTCKLKRYQDGLTKLLNYVDS